MMKLYYATGTCALASHIALEEAGAEYSTVKISFATNEQRSPEYLAINPKGRVPSLVTDRGILTETPAMLAYIAQSFLRQSWRRLTTPLVLPKCRPSTAICARRCISTTLTARAALVGPMIRRRSRR
jgi:glutathione S-transferase